MPFESWLYLCLICLLGASSPGPSLLVIIKHSVADGRRAGIRASVGHGIGVFIYALASASGLSFILDTNPFLFSIIQILGALFLIWIGFSTIMASLTAKGESILKEESYVPQKNILISNHFRDGFIIAILNPKILAFFSSLFSQFLKAGQGFDIHFYMACLAGFIDLVVYLVIVVIVTINYFRELYESYNKFILICFGGLLIILGFSIIIVQYT